LKVGSSYMLDSPITGHCKRPKQTFYIPVSLLQDEMKLYYVCTAEGCGHRWTE